MGMDPWSLIWTQGRHHRAAVAQARHSLSACLALMTRGKATEATTKGRIVVVTVAAQTRRSLKACSTLTTRGGATGALSQWQGGSGSGADPAFVAGLLGIKVENKRGSGLATEGNRRAQHARSSGRCAVEIGAMVMAKDVQGRPEWQVISPAINTMHECHITNQNS